MRLASAVGALSLALALAPSAGAISFEQEGTPYATSTAPYGVVAPNFDGFAGADVATVNGTASNLSVFLRQANGGFAEEAGSPFAVGVGPNYAAVADFNGDARPDVAVSNFVDGTVTILLRQASGGFAQEAGAPQGGRASAIASADFDGDTLPDLAIARWDSAQISVVYRLPGGGFSAPETYPVGTNPRYLAVADFNGDARPDLAVVNQGDDNVQVLLRTARSFTSEPVVPVGDVPAFAVASDFDADGRPDLAVSNYSAGSVSTLLRNASNDGFANESGSPITVGLGPLGLAVADFDDDGADDLAVTNNSADTITVLRRTSGGFTPDPVDPITTGDGPYGLAAADFDGDGRLDLAVGHDAANELRVLLNTTTAPTVPPVDTDGDGLFDPDDLCPTVPANTPDGCPVVPGGGLPPPALGETANAALVSGEVLVGIPSGSSRGARAAQKGVTFVPLTEPRQIPIGSFLDTTEGTVSLRLARDSAGAIQSGRFAAGLFKVLQSRRERAKGLTELRMKGSTSSFRLCRSTGAGAGAALSRRQIRRLRARARGRYRTGGRYSAATVRGTTWTVIDRCDGTLTKVKRGKVAVRDFRLKKTVVVKRGKRYLARAQTAAR